MVSQSIRYPSCIVFRSIWFFILLGGNEHFFKVMIENKSERKWKDISAFLGSACVTYTNTLLVKVSYMMLSWFAKAAITRYHQLDALKTRKQFFHTSGE